MLIVPAAWCLYVSNQAASVWYMLLRAVSAHMRMSRCTIVVGSAVAWSSMAVNQERMTVCLRAHDDVTKHRP